MLFCTQVNFAWVQNNIQHQAIQISILLSHHKIYVSVCVWVFNVTFNNISVISWQSVLLVEKTNDLLQVTDKLYIMFYQVHLDWTGFELTTLVMIGTDCIGRWIYNYHGIRSRPPRPLSVFGDVQNTINGKTFKPFIFNSNMTNIVQF